jgi:long-chain acyl-CoA synthetase
MYQKFNFFSKKISKFKKNIAIIEENGSSITYEELLDKTKKIIQFLEKEKKLAFILGQNNLETIVGYISFVDQGYAVALIDYRIDKFFLKRLIKTYKPSYIFCKKNNIDPTSNYISKFNFKSYACYKKRKDTKVKISNNLMLLVSTSGTTGSPRFVRQSYKNISTNSKDIINFLSIKSEDISITTLPFTYVYGLSVIHTHLFSGAKIVLTNKSIIEKKFWDYVEKYSVNNLSGVPYSYSILEKLFKKKIPNSLEYTTQAGGKMSPILIKKILDIYIKNKMKFVQMYGAAEATARMSYLSWNDAQKKIGSIGKPISGGIFHLINSSGKKIKKINTKGELVYRGKNVCMGYAERLNDLSLGDINKGLLKTGDIAYKDKNGFYFIVGRKNRYTKIFGARINLEELENILLKKGIEVYMREGIDNKIEIFFKNLSFAKKSISYLSKITYINKSVFIVKKLSKKDFTNNNKFKI